MRFSWRLTIGVALVLAPALALGFWPEHRPAATAASAEADAQAQGEHGDHSPAPLAVKPRTAAALPAGVGAAAWDGKLPEWPAGGKVFEVGVGKPYKTITQAMFLAKDGDRVIVYGGHYHGGVLIKHAVWLDVRDGADLMGHEGSIVLLDGAKGARVTGLTINHTGDSIVDEDAGISIKDSPGAILAGCTITDAKFGVVVKNSPGALIAGNTVKGKDEDLATLGEGIKVWYSDSTRVTANTVRHFREIIVENTKNARVEANAVQESRQGLHLMLAPGSTAVGNYFVGNSTGIYVMYGADTDLENNWVQENHGPSGYGIGLKEADGARVIHNRLIGNRVGLYLENSPLNPEKPGLVTGNLIAGNDLGISLTTATHDNRISGNDFIENLQQVSATGTGDMAANAWTVDGRGNYWSDYDGYDADGDGLGDVAYAPVRVFEGWMDRQPDLRWFWFTPAASAVEAAARAFPIAAPDPILKDERPAMARAGRGETGWLSFRP